MKKNINTVWVDHCYLISGILIFYLVRYHFSSSCNLNFDMVCVINTLKLLDKKRCVSVWSASHINFNSTILDVMNV